MKKKFMTILILLMPFISHSQSLLTPKPVSWSELIELQKPIVDQLENDFNLSPQCFQDIKSYEKLPYQMFMQTILWNNYIWKSYRLPDGLHCIVKINDFNDKDSSYEVLNISESKVLLSASKGLKFEENGFYEFSQKINDHNKNLIEQKVEKFRTDTSKFNKKSFDSEKNIYFGESDTTVILPQNYDDETITIKDDDLYLNKSRSSITHDQSYNFPYHNLTFLRSTNGQCINESTGTGFLISRNVSLTNGHIVRNNCGFSKLAQQFVARHKDSDGVARSHFPRFLAANIKIANEWLSNPNTGNPNDYAVLRFNESFIAPKYSGFLLYQTLPENETIETIGYPNQNLTDNLGMWEYGARVIDIFPPLAPSQFAIDGSPSLFHHGQSGSPVFNGDYDYTIGIFTSSFQASPGPLSIVNGFTHKQITNILSWRNWNPTVTIDFPLIPINGGSYNLTQIQDFSVLLNPINEIKLDGTIIERKTNLEDLVEWESSIDGIFGTGTSVSSDQLKTNLSGGIHFITTKIDSNGEQGESSIFIEIIRPVGNFTSPNQCIRNIANPNTCTFDLRWIVTDTPETSVVFNSTTGNNFATGNSGSQTVTATDGNNIKFKLYPSNQKKILLDELNTNSLSRKTPTGTLSSNLSTCSLQPTPIDPVTLQVKDLSVIKQTPPGCDVTLSWSNVKWASPSIYYKKSGQSSWTHLYKVPCQLNGTVCNGSINTRDIIPQLVLASGTQFKLLQFNQINSGQLSAPFSVNGRRYADNYEFDDGKIDRFNYLGVGIPTAMAYDHRMSNEATIGVAQHNHSFHGPAVYDPIEDIDTIQVCTQNTNPKGAINCREKFANGKTLEITVFNMTNGLDVDMEFQCGGIATDGPIDGQSIVADFTTNQTDPITTDPVTGAKTMRFRVKDHTRAIASNIACKTNRIIIKRTAGTPSENLKYSVVINDPSQTTGPILDTASSVCNHNYCIRLLGNNFGSNAFVRVRENINGSSTIATFAGNDIYNRDPLSGQDRLQFPIQNLSLQNKFNNNGLCFKVVSGSSVSNERCFTRPTTPPQGPFMGRNVVSYSPTQDVEHTSYVVVGNGGDKLKLLGNTWKKIAYNYNVTPSTILEFDFRSNQQEAEINGIGFITAGSNSVASSRSWQVFGTDQYGNQAFNNYTGSNWKKYRIPIGQTFTGQISDMVFFGDEDNHVGQSVTYRRPVLKESTDQYDDVPAQRPYDDDVRERPVSWVGGDTVHLHNFHDSGDTDWTIIYTSGTRRFRTEAIGNNADTKMTVYKWISADAHPSGNGTFINIVDQLIGVDDVAGNSTYLLNNAPLAVYAIKVESRNGSFGAGTDYQLIIDTPSPITPDQYDNVPSQRAYNDDVKEQSVLWKGSDTEHLHNFHDTSDADWTIVYMQGTRRFKTELIGQYADTKISVYKWISASLHPSGDGRFINVVDQFLGSDSSVGPSEYILNNVELGVYAVKVESRNGNYGADTDYKLIIETP